MRKINQFIIAKSIGLYINILSYVFPKKAFALAYHFFSVPRKGKLNPNNLPNLLLNAEKIKLSFNKVHDIQTYIWKGNDEVVLLVHGWESNSNRWGKLLKKLLKTGKTIIAIDGPAHGLSSGKEFNVPRYAEFINQAVLKFNPKIAIGHSIGGNTLAYFQSQYNHNFDKMILIGSPSDFKVILNNYFSVLGLNNRIYYLFVDYIKERFNITIEDFSASNFLKSTSIPGIITHDIEDTVVLFEEGKKIANSWKTAELVITKGLGHGMHDEHLYQKILAFIEI
jgi:pimeloyl-ACP methyl ester carboxylesterase